MDLNLVKTITLSVLSKISDNELNTVTLPILREKVAAAMELPLEDVLGKEVKGVILETFQEFLLSKNTEKSEDELIESEVEDLKEVEDKIASKKPKKNTDIEPVKAKEKVANKIEPKNSNNTASKPSENTTKKAKAKDTTSIKVSKPSTPTKSAKSAHIERLKSYVFKCGVRKNWKKELEDLNEKQSVAKIQGILRELGIEGKPSLAQCKAIKARRDFEAELKEIDTSNIIEGTRRNRCSSEVGTVKRKIIVSEDEDEESESDDRKDFESVEIDLKNLGDSESD